MIIPLLGIAMPIAILSLAIAVLVVILVILGDIYLQMPKPFVDSPWYRLTTDLSIFLVPKDRDLVLIFFFTAIVIFLGGMFLKADKMSAIIVAAMKDTATPTAPTFEQTAVSVSAPLPTIGPTNTAMPPTVTLRPTYTPMPLTNTPKPTQTPVPPTNTPKPTRTPVPPTNTPKPTRTPVPPTNTPKPTRTPVPPTKTPKPTKTPVPPTKAPAPQPIADSKSDFSGSQGQANWEYQWSVGQNSFNWTAMRFDGACWRTNNWEKDVRICKDSGHPGWSGDIAWRWTSEVSGRVRVKVSAKKIDTGGGDGVEVFVYRNLGEIKHWHLGARDSKGFTKEFQIDINQGDFLFFVLRVGGNSLNDHTGFRAQVYRK